YSDKFWEDRLEWFRAQADEGLLGDIDDEKTGNGVIVCKDGFRATTISREDFTGLTQKAGVSSEIREVDNSSIFCEIIVEKN
ncbi:MAG: class I SAM-dependent methyltransferase, partial [Candidatus Zixiibacteriota bacterium]